MAAPDGRASASSDPQAQPPAEPTGSCSLRIRNLNGVEHAIDVDPAQVKTIRDLSRDPRRLLAPFFDFTTDLVPPSTLLRWLLVRDDHATDAEDDEERRGLEENTPAEEDAIPSEFLASGTELEFGISSYVYQFTIAYTPLAPILQRREGESERAHAERICLELDGSITSVADAHEFFFCGAHEDRKFEDACRSEPVWSSGYVLLPYKSSHVATGRAVVTQGWVHLAHAALRLGSSEWEKHERRSNGRAFVVAERQQYARYVANGLRDSYWQDEDEAVLEQALAVADVDHICVADVFFSVYITSSPSYIRALLKHIASRGAVVQFFSRLEEKLLGLDVCRSHWEHLLNTQGKWLAEVSRGYASTSTADDSSNEDEQLRYDISHVVNGLRASLTVQLRAHLDCYTRLQDLLNELKISYDLEFSALSDLAKLQPLRRQIEYLNLQDCFRQALAKHEAGVSWTDVEELWLTLLNDSSAVLVI
ncbi:unnamed protein product [Amoebophrya sp. A120]|nr:unnamed protein product [Amoebophrya sp. A120]|eukprot:GSA120T00000132001.1